MSVHLIVQFLDLAGKAKDAGELTGQLEALLAAYEFDFYVFSLHPVTRGETGNPILAARWPRGWQDLYTAKRYALVDPTRRMLALAHRPFRLRDAVSWVRGTPNRTRMNRMLQDAARHGIADGYVFPIHGRTGLLGSLRVSGRPVELSPVELALFDMAAKKVLWRFLEVRGSVLELETGDLVEIALTRRELEVVSHLAEGLTSPEIANILQISSHTVDWYIHGLQDKMKARNRQHVVALALRKGFIA